MLMFVFDTRYTRRCTFQVALLPAKSPIKLFTLIQPIIDEFDILSRKTLVVRKNGSEVARAKVHVLFINGDGPQINELMCYGGHNQ